MTPLVDFLLARIADDEELAKLASPGPWHVDAEGTEVLAVDDVVVCEWFALSDPRTDRQTKTTLAHIARHDPARVLAECEAKRRIVEEHEVPPGGHRCIVCCVDAEAVPHPCPTMRLLALPFSSHPDYDERWRP